MAISLSAWGDKTAALATTCTKLTPAAGSTIDVIWFRCATDCYLVYSSALADGDALPANRGFLIPANEAWPIEVRPGNGASAFIAASTGTPTGYFLPMGAK